MTLGSNPISCAAPGLEEDEFVLDMATTTVAYGKVEVADRCETIYCAFVERCLFQEAKTFTVYAVKPNSSLIGQSIFSLVIR